MMRRLAAAALATGLALNAAPPASPPRPVPPAVAPVPVGTPYVDPMASPFSCKGDGTTDDTACMQQAIAAATAAKVPVALGGHIYCVGPLTVTASIRGGESAGSGFARCGAAGVDLLTLPLATAGVGIADLSIAMAPHSGENASGAAIRDQGSYNQIIHVAITNPCFGIDDDSPWIARYQHNNITWSGTPAKGCGGIRVGPHALSQGSFIIDNTIGVADVTQAGDGTFGIELLNAGGTYLRSNDVLSLRTGTLFAPGAGQSVTWTSLSGLDALGDTLPGSALVIAPQDATAVVAGVFADGVWAGQSGYCERRADCPPSLFYSGVPAVRIEAGPGLIHGVHLTGLRIMGAGGDGVSIAPGARDVTIDASSICGEAGAGVHLAQGASGVAVRGSMIGGVVDTGKPSGSTGCDNAAAFRPTAGIALDGGNADVTIADNDLTAQDTPIAIRGALGSGIAMHDNRGVDDQDGRLVAAATLALGPLPVYGVDGSGRVQSMTGGWNNRIVSLVSLGGNISVAVCGGGSVALAPYQGTRFVWYLGLGGCWSHLQ